MRSRAVAAKVAIAVVVVAIVVFWAAQPQPVSFSGRQTFETSDEGWFAYGPGARVRVTNQRERVQEGSGALELEYTPDPHQSGSAVLLVTDGALTDMQRLRFWIRTDDDTAAAVVLSEKRPDGGDYMAWFWSPRLQWQRIELLPSDFAIVEGSSAATDVNGRLDLNQVQALGFLDLGQFFGLISKDPEYPLFVKASSGTHYLQVDNLEKLSDMGAVPASNPTRIGTPERGFISWLTPGGAALGLSQPGHPLAGAAFESRYDQTPTKYVAIAHGLSNLALGNVRALSFEIASLKAATMMVYLEERNPGSDEGPRYSSTFEVSGGSVPSPRTLALSAFVYDVTSPRDEDGVLTPGKLRSISLIDVAGATLSRPEQNTLWISAIDGITP